MLTEIEVFAPAKVNIGLKVLPRLENEAYHNIESIFQTVNIKDRLKIKLTEGFDSINVISEALPLPQDNTITKAYEAFRKLKGNKSLPSVTVELEKNIPAGGGLGGGSSDAASFITGLEKLLDVKLSKEEHDIIASEVGSDVFFFFHTDEEGKGCALVTGRGEKIEEIERRNDLHFLLVFPPVHSSTKEAYSLVDRHYESGEAGKIIFPDIKVLEKMYRSPLKCWRFVNSFTPPLVARYPEIGRALEALRECGALFSDMSGSGATVFGLFASKEDSMAAAEKLYTKGFKTVLSD